MVAMIVTWIEKEGGTNVDKSHSEDIGLAETWHWLLVSINT